MFGIIKNVVSSFKNALEDPAKFMGNLAEQGFKAGASLATLSPASQLLDRVAKLFGAKPGNLDGQLLLPAVKPSFLEGTDNPLKGTGVEGLVSQIGDLSTKIDSIKQKLADPNLSEKDRQQLQFELQTLMQERMMMITTATNTLKQDHDARMAVANNLR